MLTDAVNLFDEQLTELTAFAPTDELKKQAQKVHKLWPTFKKTATGKVDKNGAAKLLDTNDTLLKACHELVLGFQKFSGEKWAQKHNISNHL